MIPLKYNVRNLRVRWVTTLMTVLGTGLVVWSSCILFGLVEGLQHSLKVSGDPLDLIVLRKGSTQRDHRRLRAATRPTSIADARRDRPRRAGEPLVAAELINIPGRRAGRRQPDEHHRPRGRARVARSSGPSSRSSRAATSSRAEGECIVSRSLSRRFKGAAIGGLLKVGEKEPYRVVGLFTAGGSAAESEVWVDLKDLAAEHQPRGHGLVRPAPRAVRRRPRPDQEDDRQRHPVQARRGPRGRLLRRTSRGRACSSRGPGP